MIFNLLDGGLDESEKRLGYRHARTVVGRRLGAEILGGTLYEVPPGERLWPYHWELGCEEFALVVTGRPTVRTPDGERDLDVGEMVHFPEGEAGAHQFVNRSDEPFRLLIASTKSPLAVAVYPESGKLMIWRQGQPGQIVRDEPVDYWE